MFDPKWATVNNSNFGVRHAEPRYTKLWRHNNLIYAMIIDIFVNKFNCSKHDVTIVSGSQATMCTCNDYSGSNVLKMEAARYSIVNNCNYESSCWVHNWTGIAAYMGFLCRTSVITLDKTRDVKLQSM